MDCGVCQTYIVDDQWKIEKDRQGLPELRILDNGPEFLAACRDKNRGCQKGTPEEPKSLTAENELCYRHYRECKAVGQFPDDSVVRRNAAVIRDVLDRVERSRDIEFQTMLLRLAEK
jgi:hypothetical protein